MMAYILLAKILPTFAAMATRNTTGMHCIIYYSSTNEEF